MKNVFKKVFSLLLVGVVAVSVLSFSSPNCANAENLEYSDNVVCLYNSAWYNAGLSVKFYKADGTKICERKSKLLHKTEQAEIAIPKGTTLVMLKCSFILGTKDWRDISKGKSLVFKIDELGIFGDDILVTTQGTLFKKSFSAECHGNWTQI